MTAIATRRYVDGRLVEVNGVRVAPEDVEEGDDVPTVHPAPARPVQPPGPCDCDASMLRAQVAMLRRTVDALNGEIGRLKDEAIERVRPRPTKTPSGYGLEDLALGETARFRRTGEVTLGTLFEQLQEAATMVRRQTGAKFRFATVRRTIAVMRIE